MVRRVSLEEEKLALQQAEALKVTPARLSANGKCNCSKPLNHCVCLPYMLPKEVGAGLALAEGAVAHIQRRPTVADAALAIAMATLEAAKAQSKQNKF
jgi:hypothetical protein